MGKKHSQQHHTGRIRHKDMTSLIDGMGGKDPLAHSSHHSMNSEHGTPQGCSPMGDYDMDGDEDCLGRIGDSENAEHHP